MRSIAWIDTNGCPNGWHELTINNDGKVEVLHIDNEECELSECGFDPDEVSK